MMMFSFIHTPILFDERVNKKKREWILVKVRNLALNSFIQISFGGNNTFFNICFISKKYIYLLTQSRYYTPQS